MYAESARRPMSPPHLMDLHYRLLLVGDSSSLFFGLRRSVWLHFSSCSPSFFCTDLVAFPHATAYQRAFSHDKSRILPPYSTPHLPTHPQLRENANLRPILLSCPPFQMIQTGSKEAGAQAKQSQEPIKVATPSNNNQTTRSSISTEANHGIRN